MSEDRTQHLPDGDMKQVLTLLNSINTRLTALEEKVDRRWQETRPIWEQVLAGLDNLESEMRTGLRKIERQIGTLAKGVLEVRADQRDLENRIDQLEPKPTQ